MLCCCNSYGCVLKLHLFGISNMIYLCLLNNLSNEVKVSIGAGLVNACETLVIEF